MIKDNMTLPLSIDTATLKATNSAMMSATDAQLMPYSIGYVPFEMLEKSAIFRKFSYGLTSAIPNNIFMYSPNVIGEAAKGVPFVYTIKSGTEGSTANIYYTGSAWSALPFANNNANMRLLHSFDTDYYINNISNFGANINGVVLRFRYIETAYNDEGWQGDAFESVKIPNTFNVTATITPTPSIALSFTHNLTSQYNGHVYTIDQTIFTKMFENGLAELDGGTYTYNGTDYAVKLYIFIDLAYIDRTYPAGNALGFGTMCIENVRYSEFDTNETTYFQQAYNASSNKWLTGNAELFVNNYPSPYGYYVTISQTGISVFRSAVMQWINMCVSGGYNLNDIKILICTALPAYKIGGNYYVAEFDDNYVITGKLIPYADARTWQTFINPDENVFDYNDIPEPGPDPSGWGDDRYGDVPGMWGGNEGVANNFVTPWVLRGTQVQSFGSFLWQNLFTPDPDDPSIINGLWQNFKNALGSYWMTGSFDVASTLDFVISLIYFPFDLTDYASDTSTKKLYFGTGALGIDIGGSYNTFKLNKYHAILNGGSLNLADPTVKSNLGIPDDFRGLANTTACIYLPFCGMYEVNWADIKDSTLAINYCVDFTTGSCITYVSSTKNGRTTYVLSASGMVGFQMPLSATNANRVFATILGDMSAIGSSVFEKGQNAAAAVMGGAPTANMKTGTSSLDDVGSDSDARTMSMMTAGGPILGSGAAAITRGGEIAKQVFSKPSIGIPLMRGGTGWNALSCPRSAYLQVRTPQYVPDGYHGHTFGWPAEKQYTVSDLSKPAAVNYYRCNNVDTTSLTCTYEERQLIKQQLESGFYIKAE